MILVSKIAVKIDQWNYRVAVGHKGRGRRDSKNQYLAPSNNTTDQYPGPLVHLKLL